MEAEVRVVLTGHGRGEVFINGEKMPCVRKVSIAAEAGNTNTVAIEINATTVDFIGRVDVTTIESEALEFRDSDGS